MARNLRPVDEQAVIDDYLAGHTAAAIRERHQIDHARMYRILDAAGTPRRRTIKRQIPQETRDQIAREYLDGEHRVEDIAARYGVSTSTVVNYGLAYRKGLSGRTHRLSRDELVDLAARWLVADDPSVRTDTALDALWRIGCQRLLPGLGSLRDVHPDLRSDVARRIAEIIHEQYVD